MKRYILILLFVLPYVVQAQDFMPEHTWHDGASADKSKWYTAQFGSTVFSFNGKLYVLNYHDEGNYCGGHTYVFTFNNNLDLDDIVPYKLGPGHSNKLVFGYTNESSSYDPGPVRGRTFCFEYNDRMWYYQHIHYEPGEHESDKDESYECYAQFPLDTLESCFTYYNRHDPPSDITKLGAFQLDTNLYFVSQNTNSSSSDYRKWYLQEYTYSSSSNHFNFVRNIEILSTETDYDMVGGIIKKVDSQGNEYIILGLYIYNGGQRIWKLTPQAGLSTRTFACENFVDGNQAANAAAYIASGSVRGNRTSDPYPDYTNRFTSFAINKNTNSDGIHNLWCLEYYISEDESGNSYATAIMPGHTISIPVSTAPSKESGDHYALVVASELEPKVFTQAFNGTYDGYQQYVWAFYPDDNSHWNGVALESDKWRMTNDSIIDSRDLQNKEKYPGIEGLWSLIGICDGGPPCSIDWEVWEDHHVPGTEPTELNFTIIDEHETEITSTYEDQWSVGESMEMSGHIAGVKTSASEEFKYSSAYKNTISNGTTVEEKLTKTFALMETNQDTAVLVWAVPIIIRYPFSAYPWWDNDQTNPVPNSFQYMFRTDGITLIDENVAIDSYPFNIEEPNDPGMEDWLDSSRSEVHDALLYNGVTSIINANWTNNQVGDKKSYTELASTTECYEHTTKYEMSAELGVSVPKVFKISASGGYEISYSTETKVENTFGSEIECDLSNLKISSTGPNINKLNLSVYWFRNVKDQSGNDPNWWYWSAYGDQRPWYIAYLVATSSSAINLQSPAEDERTGSDDLYFSWTTDGEELESYTLVIANSGYIYNGSIIYQKTLRNPTHTTLPDFQPEKGRTYYWVVKGMTRDGQMVCSDMRSFTMKDSQSDMEAGLMALIYPNPAGREVVHIAIDPVNEGKIDVLLTDLNGIVIAREEANSIDGLQVDISFPTLHLPAGIYLAVIRSAGEQVVKKVLVR